MTTLITLTDRFEHALAYATKLHAEQRRKGNGVPYVAHLLAVASLVLEHGGTEDEAIGALLHDAIEDQPREGATRTEIASQFGEAVLAIVDGCTDNVENAGRGKESWKLRKETYLKHLATASPSVRLVSAADKLHNARSTLGDLRVLGDELWERFNARKDGSLWYYRALVEEFRRAGGSEQQVHLVDELERTVSDMEQLAKS